MRLVTARPPDRVVGSGRANVTCVTARPCFLAPVGRAVKRRPLDAVRQLGGRPLYITHGTKDSRLSVDYGHQLEAAVQADGGNVESWFVEGAEHTETMITEPTEYERRVVGFFRRSLATPGP